MVIAICTCIYTAFFVWMMTFFYYQKKMRDLRTEAYESRTKEREAKRERERLEREELQKEAALDRKLVTLKRTFESDIARHALRLDRLEGTTSKDKAA